MECLVDFVKVDGRWEDFDHLFQIIETDPDPAIRHALARLMIENPPFERGHHHRLNKGELVERIWSNMNSAFSNNTALRCDMVDLYYALYGTKQRPSCLPQENDTLSKLYRPQKVSTPVEPLAIPIEKVEEEPEMKIKSEEVIEETVVPIDKIQEVETAKMEVEELQGVDIVPLDEPVGSLFSAPPPEKKPKMEYFSENSVSLPGVTLPPTGAQPTGFEPGMFIPTTSGEDLPHKPKRDSAEERDSSGKDKVGLSFLRLL